MHQQNVSSQKKKIIFLEDEEVLGRIYTEHLKAAGFEVKWLKTTKETEEMAKKIKADLVLLDQGIRGENKSGLDIICSLKAALPEAKIVMLSNFSHFQLEEEALKAGAIGYLVKINTPPNALVKYVNKLFS